jgi:hypothetical protein
MPVSLMCELLEVSESGYWAWMKRAPSDRELSDAWLIERIRRDPCGQRRPLRQPARARDAGA